MADEVQDAKVVGEESEDEYARAAEVPEEHEEVGGGGELVVGRANREVLRPLDPEEVVAAMEQYQAMLPRLLDASDYQESEGRRFVKKSGWRKIATAFNLSVGIVSTRVERAPDGSPLRAEVIARAVAPNGRTQDGDGYCSIGERRFGRAQGRQKVENDLRATATTRAKNRAISDLVGMGEVSAEEVEVGSATAGPPNGPEVSKAGNDAFSAALVKLLGSNESAQEAYEQISADCGGYIPAAVAKTVVMLAV
jgi:hypothetical protein